MIYLFILVAVLCYLCCLVLEALSRGMLNVESIAKMRQLKQFCIVFISILLIILAIIILVSMIL